MNLKMLRAQLFGLFGFGPLAKTGSQPEPIRKATHTDLERIEAARQKRLRKQARRKEQ